MTVGVQSWAAPNAPCLSEGLSGVGSGPCPPQPAQLMHSEIVPSHHIWQGNARVSPSPTGTLPHCYNKSSVFAEGSLNTSQSILGHKTIACPQIYFCWKHTAKIAVIENSVNRTISSTLSLKVPPKAQKQPKIRLAEWRLSKRILFTALTKKKKKWHTPSAFLFQIYLTEVKILLYSDSTYNSTVGLIVLFWEVLRLVN